MHRPPPPAPRRLSRLLPLSRAPVSADAAHDEPLRRRRRRPCRPPAPSAEQRPPPQAPSCMRRTRRRPDRRRPGAPPPRLASRTELARRNAWHARRQL
eukprot:350238-Chlamydomonas_euryale.AAC.3